MFGTAPVGWKGGTGILACAREQQTGMSVPTLMAAECSTLCSAIRRTCGRRAEEPERHRSDGKPQPLKDALKGQYECFTGTADLYVYFFERSLQLLRVGGVLSFITSNKYVRAAYGERLRAYLAHATRPHAILDFGDAPVFTAVAYPAIIVTRKTRSVALGQLPKSSTGILACAAQTGISVPPSAD
jgi:hypothetical protein